MDPRLASHIVGTRERLAGDRLTRATPSLQYNLDRDLFIGDNTPKSDPAIPLSICIAPLVSCNLRCGTCLSDSGPDGRPRPWPALFEVLEWMRPWAPVRLVWTGGEPTLYPGLIEAMRLAASMGSHNVVCTNSAARDPCGELAGEFFYSVSIYGIDRATFLRETQCDKFSRFVTIFEELFHRNHKVVASLRVDIKSQNRVPEYLNWLAAYPIRKVTILNTRLQGRLTCDSAPLNAHQLEHLRRQVEALSLPFPTVFPSTPSNHDSRGGLLVIERPPDLFGSIVVNGKLCSSLEEAGPIVRGALQSNGILFGAENYVWGTR